MIKSQSPMIRIVENGPYLVTGNVPLYELIIASEGPNYVFQPGRTFPRMEEYALCRCGQSKNKPFCDGTHVGARFNGTEKADRRPYQSQANRLYGPNLTLTDREELCAFARFCHAEGTSVWALTEHSNDPASRALAIETACNCPSGRLVAWDRETNQAIEPEYEPSIVLIQDPERECSGPLFVRGGIQIVSSDGFAYEIRNRVTLCRCGRSLNKPFCDAMHVSYHFSDGQV